MKTLGRQMLCYLLLCFAVTTYAEETISIDTDNTSLIYKVDKDKKTETSLFRIFFRCERGRGNTGYESRCLSYLRNLLCQ